MKKVMEQMSDEVLLARLVIAANNCAIVGESNELHDLSEAVLNRMTDTEPDCNGTGTVAHEEAKNGND